MQKMRQESRIHLCRSTGFALSLLPRFYLTICIPHFFVKLPLVIIFMKSGNLHFIQLLEIFNFIYSRLQTDCIDFRKFYGLLFNFYIFVFIFYFLFIFIYLFIF